MTDDWRADIPAAAPPYFVPDPGDVDHGVDVVGRDGDGLFCLDDDEHDRSVWWLSQRDPGGGQRFVNTSVERFGLSLTAVLSTLRSLPGLPSDEARRRLSALRRELRDVEPGVLPQLDDYWPRLLERVERDLPRAAGPVPGGSPAGPAG